MLFEDQAKGGHWQIKVVVGDISQSLSLLAEPVRPQTLQPKQLGQWEAYRPHVESLLSCVSLGLFLCSGYSQEVVCYTLGNIPQMPSAPRLVRAGVTWVTLQWNKPEGCSPEEVVTYTLEIQEDENVSFVDFIPLRVFSGSRYCHNHRAP